MYLPQRWEGKPLPIAGTTAASRAVLSSPPARALLLSRDVIQEGQPEPHPASSLLRANKKATLWGEERAAPEGGDRMTLLVLQRWNSLRAGRTHLGRGDWLWVGRTCPEEA